MANIDHLPISAKITAWAATAQALTAQTDALGRDIDRGIRDTVIALQLLGLNTFSSCAGHPGRLTGGPYVMFQSVGAKERFAQLQALGTGPADPTYQQLREALVAANMEERQKLLPLLDAFYRRRQVAFGDRLIIQGISAEASRLKVQGIELMYIESKVERRTRLRKAQTEMQAFTGFVTNRLAAAA